MSNLACADTFVGKEEKLMCFFKAEENLEHIDKFNELKRLRCLAALS